MYLYFICGLFNIKGQNDAGHLGVLYKKCACFRISLLRKEGALLGNSRRKEILSGGPLSGIWYNGEKGCQCHINLTLSQCLSVKAISKL